MRKLLTLLLALAMVLGSFTMAFAVTVPDPLLEAAPKVAGAEALAAVADGTGVIIDVRAQERHDSAHLDSTVYPYTHLPLFTVDKATDSNVPTTLSDSLADNFNKYVAANKANLEGKKIYVLCNSGATGAKNGTNLLAANGITENVYTIENGAKSIDMLKAFVITYDASNTVTGTEAVAAIGSEEVALIDVRAEKRFNAGHLKGSISLPLFTVDAADKNVPTTLDDELAAAFTKYVTENKETLQAKKIYIVCNSGQTGVVNAAKLLLNAGYSMQKQITKIEGGAKGTDTDKSVPENAVFVPASVALSVLDNEEYMVIDVRATKRYDAGHLEGTLHLPLFTVNEADQNVVTTRNDELSDAFNEYVTANAKDFAGKKILLLCNGGASGAAAGTYLLGELEKSGVIAPAGVYTIEGGANNNPSIQAAFVVDEPEVEEPAEEPEKADVPKTGDNMMAYAVLMAAAAGLVALRRKEN